MFPGRLDSLPHDLLDVLRTADAENDILDFPNLEWLLEEGAEAGQEYSPLGLQAPGLPILNYQTSHSGNLDQYQSGGSGSGPMLHEHGPQGSSGGETGDMYGVANTSIATAAAAVAAAQQQQQATQQMLAASGSFARLSESHDGGEEEAYDNSARHGPPKKKRTRNAEQMQQNRVAQQKYRERKKNEQHQLQSALDQLTAQLAMMKAMEAKAIELKSHNAELATTVAEQADRINKLAIKIDIQAVELSAAKQEAATATALAASQQRMILDQHNKLQLQEEVIEQLRGRLFEKMEHAFEGRDPKTVCQRMVAAVRAALEGAKNVEGLQESLAQLPEPIITDICKSILCEVKSMWPELASRLHMLTDGHTGCHQQEMRVNTVGATF